MPSQTSFFPPSGLRPGHHPDRQRPPPLLPQALLHPDRLLLRHRPGGQEVDGGAQEAGHARRPGDVARSGADPEDIRVRRQEGRRRREVLGLQRALQPGKTMLRISNLNYGRLNLFDVFFEIRSATSSPSTTPSSRRAPSSTSSTRCCCSASSSRGAWGEPWGETPAEAEGETSSESPTKKSARSRKKAKKVRQMCQLLKVVQHPSEEEAGEERYSAHAPSTPPIVPHLSAS